MPRPQVIYSRVTEGGVVDYDSKDKYSKPVLVACTEIFREFVQMLVDDGQNWKIPSATDNMRGIATLLTSIPKEFEDRIVAYLGDCDIARKSTIHQMISRFEPAWSHGLIIFLLCNLMKRLEVWGMSEEKRAYVWNRMAEICRVRRDLTIPLFSTFIVPSFTTLSYIFDLDQWIRAHGRRDPKSDNCNQPRAALHLAPAYSPLLLLPHNDGLDKQMRTYSSMWQQWRTSLTKHKNYAESTMDERERKWDTLRLSWALKKPQILDLDTWQWKQQVEREVMSEPSLLIDYDSEPWSSIYCKLHYQGLYRASRERGWLRPLLTAFIQSKEREDFETYIEDMSQHLHEAPEDALLQAYYEKGLSILESLCDIFRARQVSIRNDGTWAGQWKRFWSQAILNPLYMWSYQGRTRKYLTDKWDDYFEARSSDPVMTAANLSLSSGRVDSDHPNVQFTDKTKMSKGLSFEENIHRRIPVRNAEIAAAILKTQSYDWDSYLESKAVDHVVNMNEHLLRQCTIAELKKLQSS